MFKTKNERARWIQEAIKADLAKGWTRAQALDRAERSAQKLENPVEYQRQQTERHLAFKRGEGVSFPTSGAIALGSIS